MQKLLILLGVCNVLNVFDAIATHYSLIKLNGEEINPFMSYVIYSWGWTYFYAFKFVVLVFVSWTLISLARKNIIYAIRTAYILVGMFSFVTLTHFFNFFIVFYYLVP
jgi:hypothetical protein